jgi:CRISPR-associated protein Cas2
MWVIDLEGAPPRLRGLLSRWGVEVRAGLYVGSTGAKQRDEIWKVVLSELGAGANAVMIHDARCAQGFEARTAGPNRRLIVDVEGLWLARFTPPPEKHAVLPDEDVPPEADPRYLRED